MNSFAEYILSLIKCSLDGTTPTCGEVDYKKVLSFAKRQQVVGLLFYSLSKLDGFIKSEVYRDFLSAYIFNLRVSENQNYELGCLFDKFRENGVNFVPLKGTVLKQLYPKPDMRTMGDADVLINLAEKPLIDNVMKSLEFEYKYESDHEIVWKKNNVNIELHKRLIPSYNIDYYDYYGDGWKIVKNNEMNDDDTFIYIFTHFAKHYRDRGVGLKYVVDFYVFLNSKTLNAEYVETELKKLQLYEFYRNIIDTIDTWFNGKEPTEKTEYITNYLFSCYVYGNSDTGIISDGLKQSKKKGNVKIRKIFRYIFPSFKNLSAMYPILKKVPILLPFVYVYRIFDILISRPKNIKKNLSNLKYYDEDKIKQYQKELNYVGLDFNFNEKENIDK